MEKLLLTKEIVEHELNADLNLREGDEVPIGEVGGEETPCPADTIEGYYVKSGGKCVFIKYS